MGKSSVFLFAWVCSEILSNLKSTMSRFRLRLINFAPCIPYILRPGTLLPFMLISLRVAVQDCQAVPFDDGNGTLAEKEVFEKFYNCYFGKYFADSDSVQEYVNQRVEYSMDSQEKVESTGCPKKRTVRLSIAR